MKFYVQLLIIKSKKSLESFQKTIASIDNNFIVPYNISVS